MLPAIFLAIKIYLLKTLSRLILVTSEVPDWTDKIVYLIKTIGASSVIIYILDIANLWFDSNKQFVLFVFFTLLINMFVGMFMHYRNGTFDWKTLLTSTSEMVIVIVISYLVLDMIVFTGGDNAVTMGFRIVLQVATLLYPGMKVLKNIFILSNGKHPPKWLMERLYDLEKNGDLSELFKDSDKKSE